MPFFIKGFCVYRVNDFEINKQHAVQHETIKMSEVEKEAGERKGARAGITERWFDGIYAAASSWKASVWKANTSQLKTVEVPVRRKITTTNT